MSFTGVLLKVSVSTRTARESEYVPQIGTFWFTRGGKR